MAAANKAARILIYCRAFMAEPNKTKAYRQAYPASKNWKDGTVNPKASRLHKTKEVKARLKKLQAEAAERHDVTIDSLTKELDDAREMAKDAKRPDIMISATMGKGKLHGVGTEKIDHSLDLTKSLRELLFGGIPNSAGLPPR